MSARRSNTPAVSLFPFLAVLVCAMGALILLLLVTTRRIRQQSVQQAMAVVEADDETEPAVPEPVDVTPAETPEPQPPVVEPEQFNQEPQWLNEPELPAPFPAPDLQEQRMAELREEWQQTVDDLEEQQAQLRSTLAGLEASLSDDEQRGQMQQSALADARRQLDETEKLVENARQEKASLALRQSQLENEIREKQARLRDVLDEQAEVAGRFEVLPYDGQSGTTRRPILIECTEHGFLFLSDGIQLTPNDVNGFTPQQNPLLAGAEALLSYWTAQDLSTRNSDDPTGKPYVLLIVRPGGTLAYYIARRLLDPLDEPFGYELVTDQKFVAPESNPQAKAALQRAIDYLLNQRQRLQARTRGGALPVADSLRFSDGHGGFYLEEVERLRENSDTVHFGGREVERNEAGTGTAPTGPRIVDIPRSGTANSGRTPAGTPNALAEPDGLYDAQAAPDTDGALNGVTPPRRRTFDVAGRVDGTTADPLDAGTGTGAAANAGTGSRTPTAAGPALRPPGQRGGDQIDVDDPQWGLRTPGSSIGIERDVTICIDAGAVRVGDEKPLRVTQGVSREELQEALAKSLDAHVRGWGRPPNSFFWLPNIKFEVAPGGHQSYERLLELVEGWHLRSNVEFVLESTVRQVD